MSDIGTGDLSALRIDRSAPATSGSGGWKGPLLGLAIVASIVAAGFAAWPHLEARIFKTKVRVTEVSRVSPSRASTSFTATGYVVAQVVSRVAPRVPGRIAKMLVREGDRVTAGQLVAELEADDKESALLAARARVLTAQAEVARARASLAEIETQLTRERRLAEQGARARSVIEDLEARMNVLRAGIRAAEATVRAAQAEVEVARVGVALTSVSAPIDGVVLTKPLEVGEAVLSEVEMMQIADFSSLVVEIDVPEGRLSLVRIGGPCEIVLDAFPGRRIRGETLEIGRRVNRSKATVPVKVRFVDPADGVLPEMSARVSFLSEALSEEQLRGAEKTMVAASAVVSRGGRQVVFVIDDAKVTARPIRVGAREGDDYVVLDGVEPGTRVVDRPPTTLADGQSIEEVSQ